MLNEEILMRLKIKINKSFLLTVLIILFSFFLSFLNQYSFASAQEIAACGIPDGAPISCVHCKRVCACDSKGQCSWIWMKK